MTGGIVHKCEVGVESVFENSRGIIKSRRIRNHFDYEHNDQPVIDPKQQFKIHFYHFTHDSVNDRFEQLKEYNNNFSFLYNLKKLKILHMKNY